MNYLYIKYALNNQNGEKIYFTTVVRGTIESC